MVHLLQLVRAVQAAGGEVASLQAARRFGDFAILVRNPREVHVRTSDWMPEAVVLRQQIPSSELGAFWDKNAAAIQEHIQKDTKGQLSHATVYDYTDLAMRVVWGYGGMYIPRCGVERQAGPSIIVAK